MTTTIQGVTITLTDEQIAEIEKQQAAAKQPKFKVGDKVRILGSTRACTNNQIGVIIGISNDGSLEVSFPQPTDWCHYDPKWLELVPETIMDKVKSWEDAGKLLNPSYWVMDSGKIYKGNNTFNKSEDVINVTSELRAKSIRAYGQLSVIADALNEGKLGTVSIYWNERNSKIEPYSYAASAGVVKFATFELANYAIQQFAPLWYDYFMVPNPNQGSDDSTCNP